MNRNTTSFMVMKFDLTTELNGFDGLSDLGAGNTIAFTEIPAGVDVWFAVDSNSQNKIKALQGMQIQTEHGAIFFTTIGTSTSMMEIAHWASDDMKIIPPPISTFDVLNSFGLTAFNQLDKAMNPYTIAPSYTTLTASNALTTLLSKTLYCDKIDLLLNSGSCSAGYSASIKVYLDGVLFFEQLRSNNGTYGGEYSTALDQITLYGVKGKTMLVSGYNATGYNVLLTATEHTLKA